MDKGAAKSLLVFAVVGGILVYGNWDTLQEAAQLARDRFGPDEVDLWVYNGFDVGVAASLDGETRMVGPQSFAYVGAVPAGDHEFAARSHTGVAIESFTSSIPADARGDAVYNVAGRGVLSVDWVRYGDGNPPPSRLLGNARVLFPGRIDHIDTQPPLEKTIYDDDAVDDSVLVDLSAEPGVTLSHVLPFVDEATGPDHGADIALGELLTHPDSEDAANAVAWYASLLPERMAAETARARELLPASVQVHRAYQAAREDTDLAALVAEYAALLESHPDSAMHHYLLARLTDDPAAALELAQQAIALDPKFPLGHASATDAATNLGDHDAAARHAATHVALDPSQAPALLDVRLALLRMLGHRGYDTAIQGLIEEPAAQPYLSGWHKGLVYVLQAGAAPDQAAALADAAEQWVRVQDAGSEVLERDVHYLRARVLLAGGQTDAAAPHLDALRDAPDAVTSVACWDLDLALAGSDPAVDVPAVLDRHAQGFAAGNPVCSAVAAAAAVRHGHASQPDLLAYAQQAQCMWSCPSLLIATDVGTVAALDEVVQTVHPRDRAEAYATAATLLWDVPAAKAARRHAVVQQRMLEIPGELPRWP